MFTDDNKNLYLLSDQLNPLQRPNPRFWLEIHHQTLSICRSLKQCCVDPAETTRASSPQTSWLCCKHKSHRLRHAGNYRHQKRCWQLSTLQKSEKDIQWGNKVGRETSGWGECLQKQQGFVMSAKKKSGFETVITFRYKLGVKMFLIIMFFAHRGRIYLIKIK